MTRIVLVAAAALALAAPPAAPHAFLVKARPAERASVPEPPARIELAFNERLEPAYSTVSVVSGAGERVDLRDARVGGTDRKRLTVGLAPVSAGEYTVRYRVLSVDGHVVESSYRFTVRPDGVRR